MMGSSWGIVWLKEGGLAIKNVPDIRKIEPKIKSTMLMQLRSLLHVMIKANKIKPNPIVLEIDFFMITGGQRAPK